MNESIRKKQGFACLSPEERKRIASMGGKSVPAEKRAYARDNALARASGLKGGMAYHESRGGAVGEGAQEAWTGAMIARLARLARARKTLVEAREAVRSELNIPEFRGKCKRQGIIFIRTRPKA